MGSVGMMSTGEKPSLTHQTLYTINMQGSQFNNRFVPVGSKNLVKMCLCLGLA